MVEDRCVLGQVVIERIRTSGGRVNYSYHLNDPDARLSQNDIMFLEEMVTMAALGEARDQERYWPAKNLTPVAESPDQNAEATDAVYESYSKYWAAERNYLAAPPAPTVLAIQQAAAAPPAVSPPPGQTSRTVYMEEVTRDNVEAPLPSTVEPEVTFETVPGEMPGDPPPREECRQLEVAGADTLIEVEGKELGRRFLATENTTVDVGPDDCVKNETWRDRPPLL